MKKIRIWVIVIFVAVGCSLLYWLPQLYRTYFLQAYRVPSGSMMPTLLIGDHLYADMSIKNIDEINRGDIIVFSHPRTPTKEIINRVIGLPGDQVYIRDKVLFINGKVNNELYVMHKDYRIYPAKIHQRDNVGPLIVPKDSLFVLGDNRDSSNDSRYWGFVSEDDLKGKALTIYWSWDNKKLQVRWNRIGKNIQKKTEG